MKRSLAGLTLGVLLLGAVVRSDDKPNPPLAHMVFFTLKDRTPEARNRLADSCRKYLGDHEGVTYFSVGTIAEDVVEPVSDREWDVALHLVFTDKAAEARYLKHPRHTQFVEENRASFAKARVFDSYLTPSRP